MFGEENECSFIVNKIERYEGKKFAYGHPKWDDFYVRIPKDVKIEIGDKIIYSSRSVNSGSFIRIEKK